MSERVKSDIQVVWYNDAEIEWWIYRSTAYRLKMTSFKFRVVLCRIRIFPTLIWTSPISNKTRLRAVPLNLTELNSSKIYGFQNWKKKWWLNLSLFLKGVQDSCRINYETLDHSTQVRSNDSESFVSNHHQKSSSKIISPKNLVKIKKIFIFSKFSILGRCI